MSLWSSSGVAQAAAGQYTSLASTPGALSARRMVETLRVLYAAQIGLQTVAVRAALLFMRGGV